MRQKLKSKIENITKTINYSTKNKDLKIEFTEKISNEN